MNGPSLQVLLRWPLTLHLCIRSFGELGFGRLGSDQDGEVARSVSH